MNNITAIEKYNPEKGDKFFFDCNIWMYLYCPIGNYQRGRIEKYDRFLKQVLNAKSIVCTSPLILSEFFNSYLRLEFNILKSKEPQKYKEYKKDFRNTSLYKPKVQEVKMTIQNRILKCSRKLNDYFTRINLNQLLKEVEQADFNDVYYLHLADFKGMKVVTDDKDFTSNLTNVQILTANPKLLSKTSKSGHG